MLSPRPAAAPIQAGEFVVWENAFSASDLDAIEQHGDVLADAAGIGWIERGPQTDWLYQRMEEIALRINAQFFQYELFGLAARMRYGAQNSATDWHTDHDDARDEPRKISLCLQLSQDDAWQGGDLELHGHALQAAPRGRGTLVAFPAYVLQRVTPFVLGSRKSLTVWASGPEFR